MMANDQDVCVMDEKSFVRLWLYDQVETGKMSQAQADNFWTEYGRKGSRYLATYTATVGDLATLAKLAKDLGTPLGKVYFKTYGGKVHVVFKGYSGLRKVLTGTKYGVTNAKVVGLGIGEKGVKQAVRKGGILSVILVTAWNITDYFLSDSVTLGQLIGQTATDIAKIGVSSVVGSMAATAAVGTAIGTFALGPLIVAVAVGVGVALALDWLDNKYGWTRKLQSALDDVIAKTNAKLAETKDAVLDSAAEVVDGLVDLAIESARRAVVREINKYWRRWSVPGFRF